MGVLLSEFSESEIKTNNQIRQTVLGPNNILFMEQLGEKMNKQSKKWKIVVFESECQFKLSDIL